MLRSNVTSDFDLTKKLAKYCLFRFGNALLAMALLQLHSRQAVKHLGLYRLVIFLLFRAVQTRYSHIVTIRPYIGDTADLYFIASELC